MGMIPCERRLLSPTGLTSDRHVSFYLLLGDVVNCRHHVLVMMFSGPILAPTHSADLVRCRDVLWAGLGWGRKPTTAHSLANRAKAFKSCAFPFLFLYLFAGGLFSA